MLSPLSSKLLSWERLNTEIPTRTHGVVFISAVAAVALLIAKAVPLISSSLLALIIGAVAANLAPLPSSLKPGITFCEKKILEVAIVLMGLGISITTLAADIALLPVLASVTTALVLGIVVAPRMGYAFGTSALVGIGCAICGSAAIAAAQKPLRSSDQDIANALAGIHIVGFGALFAIPLISELLELSPDHAALLLGGSLPAMGHVVAGGFSLSQEVGEHATVIKLARIAMLVPLLIGLYLWQASGSSVASSSTGSRLAGIRQAMTSIPAFIIAFALLATLRSTIAIPPEILGWAKVGSGIALTMALAAIGCKLNLRDTLRKTTRALQLTLIIMASQLSILWAFNS